MRAFLPSLLLVVSIALTGTRLAGLRHPAFQTMAHLYVGGLIGARIAGGPNLLIWHAVGLSVMEIVSFLLLRK